MTGTEQNPNTAFRPGTLAAILRSRARRRVLLVGESPARGFVAALDPGSRSGSTLRGMLGRCEVDAVNLCGDRWSQVRARVTARSLYEDVLAGREVVLLGRKVVRAFSRLSPHLDALAEAPPFSLATPTVPRPGGGWARAMVWSSPHPSGRCRWWNSPDNRRLAGLFLGHLVGRLEFPAGPELPPPSDMARGALEVLLDELGGVG